MTAKQKPVVGSWYMTASGQLVKVWASCYHGGDRAARLVIEYLNGKRRLISISEWEAMDVEIHLYSHTVQGGSCR